jgi:type II secretory pathway pseudopilin PulG
MRKKGGYTIVEVLVIALIIGVLSSIVMASTMYLRKKARDAARVSDVSTLHKGFLLYEIDNGRLPDPEFLGCNGNFTSYCLGNPDGLGCGAPWSNTGCLSLNAALEPYMSKIPQDPATSTLSSAYIFYPDLYVNGEARPAIVWGMEEQIESSSDCQVGIMLRLSVQIPGSSIGKETAPFCVIELQ